MGNPEGWHVILGGNQRAKELTVAWDKAHLGEGGGDELQEGEGRKELL